MDVEPDISDDFGLPAESLPDLTRSYGPPGYRFAMWIWAGLALGLAALGLVIWRAWLSRPKAPLALESTLTDAVRSRLSESYDPKEKPKQRPQTAYEDEPKPRTSGTSVEPAPFVSEPPRLDLSLRVTSATRSVMMFTLNFRLTINNRTGRAVRNLSLWGHLSCAQRGESDAGSFAKGAPIGSIERIGPQQGHTIEGSVQLPMTQVKAIRQGAVPMFIPLLHITLEAPAVGVHSTSFVVGMPSESNAMRVHPITLDTPPGAIRGLRANEIKPFVADEPA